LPKILFPSVLRTIVAEKLLSLKWIFASNGFETPINMLKFASNSLFASLSSISLCKLWDLQRETLFRSLSKFLLRSKIGISFATNGSKSKIVMTMTHLEFHFFVKNLP